MINSELTLTKKFTIFCFAAIILLLTASALSFFFFDNYAFSFLYQKKMHWDNFKSAEIFKLLGKTYLLAWLILFYAIIKKPNRPAVLALLVLLAVAAIVFPVKLATHRERPENYIDRVYEQKNEERPSLFLRSWSFPSGDTANVFAVAFVLLPFIRKRVFVFFLPVCACIGIFRILVFAHYPSDAFGGAAAGILAAWIVLKNFSRRKLPDWVDSKQFFSIQIIAFILIPAILAVSDLENFLNIVCTYGVLLAVIFIANLLRRKQRLSHNQ
jgi:membrane-associated phospholipid phosphatase